MLIDRLEELLALMEAEDEDDEDQEREDAPALTGRPVPAVSPEEDDGEAAPAGSDGRSAPAKRDDAALRSAAAGAAKDGPDQTERPLAGEAGAVREEESGGRRALSERRNGAVEAARRAVELEERRRSGETGDQPAGAARHESGAALEELYRRTVQAGRPSAAQAPGPEQAGRTRYAEEPGRTAALTVDELDRAVRRDSRRYDGGMTIF